MRGQLFVSISQVIGCEDRLQNDLYCVGWGVKLYLLTHSLYERSLTLVLFSLLIYSGIEWRHVLLLFYTCLSSLYISHL